MKAIKKISIFAFGLLAFPMLVLADNAPTMPLLVYGDVTIDGSVAPIGSTITATGLVGGDIDFTTTEEGKYVLDIPGENAGVNIIYNVNSIEATQKICLDPMVNASDEINLSITNSTTGGSTGGSTGDSTGGGGSTGGTSSGSGSSSGGGGGGGTNNPPSNLSINTVGIVLENKIDLAITAQYANMMMISNSVDFDGAEWIGFSTSVTDWELEDTTTKIYIKFRSSTGLVSDVISCAVPDIDTEIVVAGVEMDYRTIQLNNILADATFMMELNISDEILNENEFYQKYTIDLVKGIKNLSILQINTITNFIEYGTETTLKLGAGERAGVVNSYKSAFEKLPTLEDEWADVIKIGNGRWPNERSEMAEANAAIQFKKVYLREADMSNANDNAAITIIAYGLRTDIRNMESEKAGILTFKHIYSYHPSSATDWDIVRAIAYSGAIR